MNTRIASVVAGLTACVAMVIWSTWSRTVTTAQDAPVEQANSEPPHATRVQRVGSQVATGTHATKAAQAIATLHAQQSSDPPLFNTQPISLSIHFLDPDASAAKATGKLEWSRIIDLEIGRVTTPLGEANIDATTVQVLGLAKDDWVEVILTEPNRFAAKQLVKIQDGVARHEVRLIRGLVAPQLEIPVVNQLGQPILDTEFVLLAHLSGTHLRIQRFQRTSDEHGVIRLNLPRTGAGRIEVGNCHQDGVLHHFAGKQLGRRHTTKSSERPPDIAYGIRAFPHMEPATSHRLAKVVVQQAQPRISGTVRGLDGTPARGVEVLVGSPSLPEQPSFRNYKTTTDDAGKFTIVAGFLPEQVFLCARGHQVFSEPRRFLTEPNAPIVLQLQATGSLSFPARIGPILQPLGTTNDSWIAAKAKLTIKSTSLDDGWWTLFRRNGLVTSRAGPAWVQYVQLNSKQPLVVRDLVPQSYDIEFLARGNREPHMRDVVINSGQVTSPAN
ncbi:MAG: hypothetical protein ACI91B_000070 [Planctomycetota bacterium]|jgi:hypothetical protein